MIRKSELLQQIRALETLYEGQRKKCEDLEERIRDLEGKMQKIEMSPQKKNNSPREKWERPDFEPRHSFHENEDYKPGR